MRTVALGCIIALLALTAAASLQVGATYLALWYTGAIR